MSGICFYTGRSVNATRYFCSCPQKLWNRTLRTFVTFRRPYFVCSSVSLVQPILRSRMFKRKRYLHWQTPPSTQRRNSTSKLCVNVKHSKFITSLVLFPFYLTLSQFDCVDKFFFVFQAIIFFDFIQKCKPDAFSADLLETVLNYIQKICHARYSEHDCALAILKILYCKYLSMNIYNRSFYS